MNEAAIVAARRDKDVITFDEIDYALDRLQVGMQKTTGMQYPARQKLVAYHEAGHAVAGLLTPDYDMVTKVTIIPRTNGAGGFTLFTPSEERLEKRKEACCFWLLVCWLFMSNLTVHVKFGCTRVFKGVLSTLQCI